MEKGKKNIRVTRAGARAAYFLPGPRERKGTKKEPARRLAHRERVYSYIRLYMYTEHTRVSANLQGMTSERIERSFALPRANVRNRDVSRVKQSRESEKEIS